MKVFFLTFLALFVLIGTSHAEYVKFTWDAPENGIYKGYNIYYQNCTTGYIKSYQTVELFYLITDMELLDNIKYKIWIKAFNQDIETGRSNEIYYHSEMPTPPQNLRILE